MSVSKFGRGLFRKLMTSIGCVLLLLNGAPGILVAASSAAITGVIVDPAGHPAYGFKVVLRDVASNQKFQSEPTDAQGNYTAQVPVGGRYKIDHVIADDGLTELPVQDAAPVSVLTAGTTLMNVRFANGPTSAGAGTTSAPAASKTAPAKKPWYHRPGPIVGIVLGSAAVVGLALAAGSGSSGTTPASPSTPAD